MAYVPGVALLAALVVGCSADADSNASGADSKAGSPTVTPAPPGKYLTLPAPCRAVPRSTLKDLLPGAAELPGDQQEKVFRGTASVTYDTDRKVGCGWKSDAPDATRSLSIDFERVVSYDPAISDDDRADTVYAKKEKAAGLSSSTTPGPDAEKNSGTPDEKDKGKDKGKEKGQGKGSGEGEGGAEGAAGDATASSDPSSTASPSKTPGGGGSASSSGSPEDVLPSRILDNLGDAAFLHDLPKRSGSTAQNHTVSVVFRTSNVVVTVRYAEQPALVTQEPDGAELQEKAQALARKLAETLSE
ncbi:DUF3558 domain-containing protein [Streptomyces sp. SID14515]|uniref:DUF3558 domain-containing protein n=1 Tax=Streptomyces sp. SID14515 TaxID=2706074 RepID=UPI0013CB096A|nr:DUF3558 domain-containing protein [Streptomyces sp. SID14515]NEB42631.1 DUF3558 domain-containing protein [Streptomyces sp. SID14515]